jgi:hypothetical protein
VPARRLLVDLCVIHRSVEIKAEEHAPDLALVAVISGSKPHVSLLNVHSWVANSFNILRDCFQVKIFQPEDFIITFSYYDDMLRVLHDPPAAAPFSLVLKHWWHQLTANVENLRFKVQLEICGIPAHAWNLSMAQQLLSSSCSHVHPSTASSSKADFQLFMVEALCVHPDLIPCE